MQAEADMLDELGPEHYDELLEVAKDLLNKSNSRQALGYLMLAIKADPTKAEAKKKFITFGEEEALNVYNPFMEETIVECLRTEGLNVAPLRRLWFTLLLRHPCFSVFFSDKGAFDSDRFDVSQSKDGLLAPFFLLGISKFLITNTGFERFLTELRRRLLRGDHGFQEGDRAKLATVLAHYCFNTEYVFAVTDDETAAVSLLHEAIGKGGDVNPSDVAMLACYVPLYKSSQSEAIADNFRDHVVISEIIRDQIDEHEALTKVGLSIQPITTVVDEISNRVRSQYEEFPYPRWRIPERFVFETYVSKKVSGSDVRFLVAGCGTGHEPAMMARALPENKIMAVDLSIASLSYAAKRTKELGLHNIEFRHGDILNLGSLPHKFDVISCGGVLHHMREPLKGWKVLVDLLEQDGLMRIALYSKVARKQILETQEFIRKNGYAGTAEGIRRFRADAPTVLDKDAYEGVINTTDYFSMSMCRDLLFHVQEHDFDIPEIKSALDHLGLEFRGFSGILQHMPKYKKMFPKDKEALDLDQWDVFERKNPSTFGEMYQFWCSKRKI